MPDAIRFNLPFQAAIDYFRDKLNVPTEAWDTLWKQQHQKSFSVAGAVQQDLIQDLRESIDQVLAEGGTIRDFQDNFDQIVQDHGWRYKGERGWRTNIMLYTNLATAYHAGHWQRMTDPDVVRHRPYLRYVPSSSRNPRKEHAAWYNVVLPADDEWWKTHYPPNGWGCK